MMLILRLALLWFLQDSGLATAWVIYQNTDGIHGKKQLRDSHFSCEVI